ncbi:T9SS type B sorting domain-containing protein [Winogradskyella maritima]|uniref:T9SS type B sorting domain-containing protein n=1 Tax=Winogradskyella maritima TaxID=1517766 RepID=A0ABV8AJL4_9FLAO|nr:T9SS type B sorting domain-containing protein [Winogradskyella maritima]
MPQLKIIPLLLFFVFTSFAFAQQPNDCAFSVTVCGNSSITIDVDGIGTQELSGSNTCQSQENNSIWFNITIATSGTLGFVLTPNSTDISEDYDFFIFGPNRSCGNIGQAIRCSTTNPQAAGQGNNLTGMNASETDPTEGPGADGNSFVSELQVTAGETYFLVIDRPIGNSPFSLEWTGTATFPDNPVNPVSQSQLNLEICDNKAPFDDGIADFDLSNLQNQIENNQSDIEVSFHENVSDANINDNVLPSVYESLSGSQSIYVRIENSTTGCFIVNQVDLSVVDSPEFNTPTDFLVCDDLADGDDTNESTTFDFNIKTAEMLAGIPSANYQISYHTSQNNAQNNDQALPLLYTVSTPNPIEIFVRIEDLDAGCVGFSSFNIEVIPVPLATDLSLFQCDEFGAQDGIAPFNLSQSGPIITDITGSISVTFYRSFAEAETQSNPLNATNYLNNQPSEIVFARVTNTDTNCFAISEISLEVSVTSANDALLQVCDADGVEDGFTEFDLSQANDQVLNNLPPNLTLSYFETLDNALLEENPLDVLYTNTEINNQIIFVRVENDNQCYGINEIELEVLDVPNVIISENVIYCLNRFPEPITLSGGVINDLPNNYFYNWSTGETTSEIQVSEAGVFTVRVSNTIGCFIDRTVTVIASNIATIEGFNVMDASQNNTVTVLVSGEGDYEFSLDNVNGPYQDSNIFDDVRPGIYTVYVRDKNNCGISEDLVSLVGFPRYFTPNGDGNHDFWQVQGISSQFQPKTIVYIFDRFGKLLAEIDPTSSGWDGTYNDNPMPTSDYWFSVKLEDGRQFSSHFTLKR